MDRETYTTDEISNIKNIIQSDPQCVTESYKMISTCTHNEILIMLNTLSVSIEFENYYDNYYNYVIIYKNIAITIDLQQNNMIFAYINTDIIYTYIEFLKNFFVDFIVS